ncbi:MAG: MgtC/SapB family protein [Verrucomicrobiia bacterium]
MSTESMLLSLLVSASLGALIGLERQWAEQHAAGEHVEISGVRTFALWALLGNVAALLSSSHAPHLFAAGFLAGAGLLLAHHLVLVRVEGKSAGLTTITATLLTYLIGGLVAWERARVGVVLAVSLILLLASKRTIHRWTERFTRADVLAALQFAAITGVILPIAPNRDFGPYGAFNPFSIWLMVVLVAGIGFFGYVAVRLLGPRAGLVSLGLLGGLASSTATTLACSRQSRERPELSDGFAAAIVLACTVMLARVAVLCFAVSHEAFLAVWPALLIMAIPGLAFGAWTFLRRENRGGQDHAPAIPNPLSLKLALQFAALYALIVLLSRAARAHYGAAGLQIASVISGLTDMDAIALSVSQMVSGSHLSIATATGAIVLAVISNTALKTTLALTLASPRTRRGVALVMVPTLLLGVLAWWVA